MKQNFFYLLFIIIFLIFVSKTSGLNSTITPHNETASYLTQLANNETFYEFLATNPNAFVLFYRDNRASLIYIQAFENFVKEQKQGNSSFSHVSFAAIDMIASIPLRKSQNLTHLPLLRLYKGDSNKTVLYEGGRSEEALRKWLGRQFKETPSLIQEIKTLKELDELIIRKSIVIAYFGEKNSRNREIYVHAAEKYPYYNFISGFSIELYDTFIQDHYPEGRVMCFNNNDQENYTLERTLNKSSLRNFFEGCSHRSHFQIDFETADTLFNGKESFMILVVNSTANESVKALPIYKQSKALLAGKIILTIFDSLNSDERVFGYIENVCSITKEDAEFLPHLLIIDRETTPRVSIKYKFLGGVYTDSILNFFDSWKKKTLTPFFKNLPTQVLEKNEGLVVCLNLDGFLDFVVNSTKDSFLMVYSLKCEACQRYKKIMRKLADKYKEIENLKFFMIDGINNDIPGLELTFVPSFFLYKKDEKKSPIAMINYKEEERFHEFLRENLGSDWKEEKDEL